MATIGFFNYADFLAEIEGASAMVRVEAYHHSTPTKLAPLENYDFFVECASVIGGDTMVFRLHTGMCQHYGQHDDSGNVEKRQRRAEHIAATIHAQLVESGFRVRPGLIAAAAESKTTGAMPEFVRAALEKIKENDNE